MTRHADDDVEAARWQVRRAVPDDAGLLWRWASDPNVRENSFSPEPIAYRDHAEWLSGKLSSSDSAIYVIERDEEAVGQVRYDRVNADEAEIDISIASQHRGRGYGKKALELTRGHAVEALGVAWVTGVVLASNGRSAAMFLNAGFAEIGPRTIEGRPCRVFRWPAQRDAV